MTALYLVTQGIPEDYHHKVRNSRVGKPDRNCAEEQIDSSTNEHKKFVLQNIIWRRISREIGIDANISLWLTSQNQTSF